MAASNTLPQPFANQQISKSGVLVLHGYGIRVTMQAGHLQVEDGIGPQRRRFRLPRVNHRLKRLVCIGDDGFITLAALRWLTEVEATFAMLDRLGKVQVVTGPSSPSDARLRRAQAVSLGNGVAVKIARELISAKLEGQETVVREKLQNIKTGDAIAALRVRLADAADLNTIRSIESRAAAEYWNAWRDITISFPRKDVDHVPTHWLTFGSRHSPLTGGPRLSINPANTLLNYTNAVAESECRLAACACGLDPALGFLHTDTGNRDSLALDLIETIRPAIEAWLLEWLIREPLRRSDFSEAHDGNCRLSNHLCSRLSETAPTWARLVAPWAEYVAHSLLGDRGSETRFPRGFKTPLTQNHRRQAKGAPAPELKMPKVERMCHGCGAPTRYRQNCPKCGRETSRQKLIELAKIGRVVSHSPTSQRKQADTQRRHRAAQEKWRLAPKPEWLTATKYEEEIQPGLSSVAISKIASAIGVSQGYAALIRAGRYRPHPCHWEALAKLASVGT